MKFKNNSRVPNIVQKSTLIVSNLVNRTLTDYYDAGEDTMLRDLLCTYNGTLHDPKEISALWMTDEFNRQNETKRLTG